MKPREMIDRGVFQIEGPGVTANVGGMQGDEIG